MIKELTYQTRMGENGQELPAENLRKVFISYKKSDDRDGLRDAVASLILECMSVAVWKDANLTPGVDYDREIEKAISESDAVVLLLTEHVMESSYIWETEIPYAQKLEKGIIPLRLGISDQALLRADEKLKHLHCLSCPQDAAGRFQWDDTFRDNLRRALDVHVMDVDLVSKITRFFSSEKHKVSVRYLSYEQIFYMGCGYLSGIGIPKNTELSISMLRSVIHGYGDDPEFTELKRVVAEKLFYHYTQLGELPAVREYGLLALEYGSYSVIGELLEWYSSDQYPELLQDMSLRKAYYQAVRENGMRGNAAYVQYSRPAVASRQKLVPFAPEPAEKKKAAFWVDGHEFYLIGKKIDPSRSYTPNAEKTVYLMRDDMAIDSFSGGWIVNGLFMYYEPAEKAIYMLESDFDHYGPVTEYSEYVYHNILGDTVERENRGMIGCHNGLARLPYVVVRW